MQRILGAVGLGDTLQVPTSRVQDNVSAGFFLVIPVSRHDNGDLRCIGGDVPTGISQLESSSSSSPPCSRITSIPCLKKETYELTSCSIACRHGSSGRDASPRACWRYFASASGVPSGMYI